MSLRVSGGRALGAAPIVVAAWLLSVPAQAGTLRADANSRAARPSASATRSAAPELVLIAAAAQADAFGAALIEPGPTFQQALVSDKSAVLRAQASAASPSGAGSSTDDASPVNEPEEYTLLFAGLLAMACYAGRVRPR